MESEIGPVENAPYARVTYYLGADNHFEAVIFTVSEGELAVAGALHEDANVHVVSSDLVLAAAHVPGLPPQQRIRLLTMAAWLTQMGLEEEVKNGARSDESDMPF